MDKCVYAASRCCAFKDDGSFQQTRSSDAEMNPCLMAPRKPEWSAMADGHSGLSVSRADGVCTLAI